MSVHADGGYEPDALDAQRGDALEMRQALTTDDIALLMPDPDDEIEPWERYIMNVEGYN